MRQSDDYFDDVDTDDFGEDEDEKEEDDEEFRD